MDNITTILKKSKFLLALTKARNIINSIKNDVMFYVAVHI